MTTETLLIILTSYLRPQNMERQIDIFSNITHPFRIVLLNANPNINLKNYLSSKAQKKVEIVNSSVRKHMLYRYGFAYKSPHKHFLLIDDDLFYTTEQMEKLIDLYFQEPNFIHGGGFGQKIVGQGDSTRLRRCTDKNNGEVDVVNRIYCFGRRQVENLKQLLDLLDTDFDYSLPGCDILLSLGGLPARPRCHDLGDYENCPTFYQPDVAVCRRPGFRRQRSKLIQQIHTVL